MQVGAFSISLSVTDIKKSKAFYETLGFSDLGGVPDANWCIMKNGDAIIGLFEGMFEGNLITFNPGWDQNAQNVDPFDDVRAIKAAVTDAGIAVEQEQGGDSGPGSFEVKDPDGNVILVDQHR